MRNKTTKRPVGKPKGSGKYARRIICRVPSQHANFIATMQKNYGLTQSDVIRNALDHYMRKTV